MEKLIFRQADNGDIENLVKLRFAYVDADYGAIDAATEAALRTQLEEYFPAHLNKDIFGFICFDGEKAVSMVLLYIMDKPAFVTTPSGKSGTLLSVVTLPEYRKRGIAGKLVGMALEKAEQLGADFVELQATADGEPLYRKIGFKDKESHYKPMIYKFDGLE
ncbi:MAG: GNAT family N-acetyltransferase [Oscillospiraceae bacterium]|nr:GNAT family N-acetyltransferase [Oscillospiraceae bacterium]